VSDEAITIIKSLMAVAVSDEALHDEAWWLSEFTESETMLCSGASLRWSGVMMVLAPAHQLRLRQLCRHVVDVLSVDPS
jgi:hypothetical protein